MRHKVKSSKINRKPAHLKAMVRNLVTSIIIYEWVTTTRPKAKLASRVIDRLIATAKKKDKMSAIRYIQPNLFWKNASLKIMDVLIDKYKDRPSWFTRIMSIWKRPWDSADKVRIQFV